MNNQSFMPDADLWQLVMGLRWKNGRLQQRWLRCSDNAQEWRDVPEAEAVVEKSPD